MPQLQEPPPQQPPPPLFWLMGTGMLSGATVRRATVASSFLVSWLWQWGQTAGAAAAAKERRSSKTSSQSRQ